MIFVFGLLHLFAICSAQLRKSGVYDVISKQLIDDSTFPNGMNEYKEVMVELTVPVTLSDELRAFYEDPEHSSNRPLGLGITLQELQIQVNRAPDQLTLVVIADSIQVEFSGGYQTYVKLIVKKNNRLALSRLGIQMFVYKYQHNHTALEVKQLQFSKAEAIAGNQTTLTFEVEFAGTKLTAPIVQLFLNGFDMQGQFQNYTNFEIAIQSVDIYGFKFTYEFDQLQQAQFLSIYITYAAFEDGLETPNRQIICDTGTNMYKTYDFTRFDNAFATRFFGDFAYEPVDPLMIQLSADSLLMGLTSFKGFLATEFDFQAIYENSNSNNQIDMFLSTTDTANPFNRSNFTLAYFTLTIIECINPQQGTIVFVKLVLRFDSTLKKYQCLGDCINNMTAMGQEIPWQEWVQVAGLMCSCQIGQYLKELRCYPCDKSCKSCTGQLITECLLCAADFRKYDITSIYKNTEKIGVGYCLCAKGYYEDDQRNCLKCHKSCYECINGTASYCMSCSDRNATVVPSKEHDYEDDLALDSLRLAYLQEKSYGKCLCLSGYFMRIGVCRPCHFTCLDCRGFSLMECVSCPPSRKLRSGICDCRDGYFNLGEMYKGEDPSLLFSRVFPQGTVEMNLEFLQSYLLQTRVQQQCYQCHQSCRQCVGLHEQNCTSCYGMMLVQVSNTLYQSGICECPSSYFMDSSITCQPCEAGCKKCIQTSTGSCYLCGTQYVLQNQSSYRGLTLGICRCPKGYAPMMPCRRCDPSCKECSGVNKDQCTDCDKKLHLEIKWDGTCTCVTGYYMHQTHCYRCSPQCNSCVKEANGCLICAKNRIISPQCRCSPGYYQGPPVHDQLPPCEPCSFFCKTCVGPLLSQCLTCKYEQLKLHNVMNEGGQNIGTCACVDQTLQYSVREDKCVESVKYSTYSYFEPLNHKQYLVVNWDKDLYIPLQVILKNLKLMDPFNYLTNIDKKLQASKGRKLSGIYDDLNKDLGLDIDNTGQVNLTANYLFNNSALLIQKILDQWIMSNASDVKRCQYRIRTVQVEARQMVFEIEYFINFASSTLSFHFNVDERLVTDNIVTIPPLLLEPGSLTVRLGPLQTIDPTHLVHEQYNMMAEVLYHMKHNFQTPRIVYAVLRSINFIPIMFPTVQAAVGLFQLSSNISTSYYYFMSMLAYTIHQNISDYSYQVIPFTRGPEMSAALFGYQYSYETLIKTNLFVPHNLRKLRLAGLYVLDFETMLLVWGVCFLLKVVLEFLNKAPPGKPELRNPVIKRLLMHVSYFFTKVTKASFYTASLGLMLEIKTMTGNTDNDFIITVSLFVAVFVLFLQILLIVSSLKGIVAYDDVEYLITEVLEDPYVDYSRGSRNKKFKVVQEVRVTSQQMAQMRKKGARLEDAQREQVPWYEGLAVGGQVSSVLSSLMASLQASFPEDSCFSITEQQYMHHSFVHGVRQIPHFKRMFKYYALLKRIILAALVVFAEPRNQDEMLLIFFIVQIIYTLTKLLMRPYKELATFALKLLGDIAFTVAVYCTYRQEILFQDLYAHSQLNDKCEEEALIHDYEEWLLPIQYGWVASFAIILFIFFYLLESLISMCFNSHETIHITKRSMVTLENQQKEQQILLLDYMQEQMEEVQIQQYRLFNYSELFNWGICMDNDLLTVRWWSQMVQSPGDEDSHGVTYTVTLINKSPKYTLIFDELKFEQLEYERRQKESISNENKVLQPNSFKTFEKTIIMDFATLTVYNDFLRLMARIQIFSKNPRDEMKLIHHKDTLLQFDYQLCTSELKLLSNYQDFCYENFQVDKDKGGNMGIIFTKHLRYHYEAFNILQTEFKFISVPSGDHEAETQYLAKFRTHFHRYKPLDFYLELTERQIMSKARVRIYVNDLTKDLVMWSGYRQVLEKWGTHIYQFMKEDWSANIKEEE